MGNHNDFFNGFAGRDGPIAALLGNTLFGGQKAYSVIIAAACTDDSSAAIG